MMEINTGDAQKACSTELTALAWLTLLAFHHIQPENTDLVKLAYAKSYIWKFTPSKELCPVHLHTSQPQLHAISLLDVSPPSLLAFVEAGKREKALILCMSVQ